MKKECYLIGDSDNDKNAETGEYTNGVIGLVLRAIQEACRDGADEVSVRFTAEAKRQCCVADVLKALKKSGYGNYEYDNYRNLLVKLRKKGENKTETSDPSENKSFAIPMRYPAELARRNADKANKKKEYEKEANGMVEALLVKAHTVSTNGGYSLYFEIGYTEPNRSEIINCVTSALIEQGYTINEELDHKRFCVNW